MRERTTAEEVRDPVAPPAGPDFTIIVPCFQEEATIEEFHARLSAAIGKLDQTFEIVYVSDGSTDGTISRLEDIFERDESVTNVVDLARNFGQTNAQTAGIERASGRHIIFMDCDLQVNPEDLGVLLAEFDTGAYDMVGGVRVARLDSQGRVWLSRFGNAVISRLLGLPMRDLGCGMKIVNGDIMRSFHSGPCRPLDPGEAMLCLRSVSEVPITHQQRRHGRSRWTWRRVFVLYHNVFTNLLPGVYSFIVVALLLFLIATFGYLMGAWMAPSLFPLPGATILIPLLVTLHMILSLGFFLILGEFMLHGSAAENGLAYVVRHVWTRPWKRPPSQ